MISGTTLDRYANMLFLTLRVLPLRQLIRGATCRVVLSVGLLGFLANASGQSDRTQGDGRFADERIEFVSTVVAQSSKKPISNEPEERDLDAPWETFRPTGMDASFEMPKQPKLRERSFTPVSSEPAITVRLHQCVLGKGDMMFVAGWHDLHTIPKNTRQQNDILNGAIKTAVANVIGVAGKETTVRLERYPGRQVSYRFTAAKEIYRVIERVYLVGARQYQFRVLAKVDRYDGDAAQRFFDSVKLLDPDNDLPPRPRKRKR